MTELQAKGGLADVIDRGLVVLFCGVNPGLEAAATGHHFAGRSNRFWRTMHLSGFTPERLAPEADRSLLRYGCGLTTVVERPTARADQLSQQDFTAAAAAFDAKIVRYAPRFVAFLGKAAYCALSGRREVVWGPQPTATGGAATWILPNPSGRNRAFSFDQLVEAYGELHAAAFACDPRLARS
jgi:double-stranded uracil-DNA glycosylase